VLSRGSSHSTARVRASPLTWANHGSMGARAGPRPAPRWLPPRRVGPGGPARTRRGARRTSRGGSRRSPPPYRRCRCRWCPVGRSPPPAPGWPGHAGTRPRDLRAPGGPARAGPGPRATAGSSGRWPRRGRRSWRDRGLAVAPVAVDQGHGDGEVGELRLAEGDDGEARAQGDHLPGLGSAQAQPDGREQRQEDRGLGLAEGERARTGPKSVRRPTIVSLAVQRRIPRRSARSRPIMARQMTLSSFQANAASLSGSRETSRNAAAVGGGS
jgi:hypothetical protein